MRLLLVSLVLVTSVFASQVPIVEEAPDVPPRVLLIDLDDVGHGVVAAARTPTLDGMRERGRYYTTLVTAPTCSPSRAMMQTGARCSHPDVLFGRVLRNKYKGSQAYALPTEPLMPIASLAVGAGLSTAKVGKWHLSQSIAPTHPNDCGWQTYRGSIANLIVKNDTYRSFRKVVKGKEKRLEGPYITTDETNDAIAAVTRGVDLVSVSYHAPHKPWHVPPAELLEPRLNADGEAIPFDVTALTEEDMTHLMLEACDHELGRLLKIAEEAGYTVFVFGDNGGQNSREEKGGKGTLYESGVTVPMWVVGPGVVPGVDDSLLSMVDFYGTVTDLLGIERDRSTQGPDSVSFAPTLRGEPGTRTHAYTEIFDVLGEDPRRKTKIQWRRAVRGERFKLFENRGARFKALYDLEKDPGEAVNLLEHLPLSAEALAANRVLDELLQRL